MCEYHLNVGDMFRTRHGLGLIVEKKNGVFRYSNVGDDQRKNYQTIAIKQFYNYCDDRSHNQVLEVMLLPNRKYRRKRK